MNKRTKNKVKKPRPTPKRKPQRGPIFFPSPLSSIPFDDLKKHVAEVGRTAEKEYNESLEKILESISLSDPVHLLSTFAYFSFGQVDMNGKRSDLSDKYEINQSHIELLQALILTKSPADLHDEYNPSVIESLLTGLPKLAHAFSTRRMALLEEEKSKEQKSLTVIQELLRLHTQSVRNWGYFDKVKDITNKIYEDLGVEFQASIGLSIKDLLILLEYLARQVEIKLNKTFSNYREIIAETTIEKIARRFHDLYPNLISKPEDFLEAFRGKNVDIETSRAFVLNLLDFNSRMIYIFYTRMVANDLQLSESSVQSIFEKLSLKFGDLKHKLIDHIFLENPVWTNHLLQASASEFYCFSPQTPFSFIRQVIDNLISGDHRLQKKCEDKRAQFLEDELETLLKKYFPSCKIVRGYKWTEGSVVYENDIIIQLDSHLILIEAKSGTISWAALRGAPGSAEKQMSELIIKPSIQSARLLGRIQQVISNPDLMHDLLPSLDLPINKVKTVLRLSVTLEDIAMTQSNLHTLEGSGWIPEGHRLAPCILFSDLQIVFEILESESLRLHYLKQRTELIQLVTTMGDELDHLGLYLDCLLNLKNKALGGKMLQLMEYSEKIDTYFTNLADGIQIKKPQPQITTWWRDICDKVEERKKERWTDLCCVLLDIDINDQMLLEKEVKKLQEKIVKSNYEWQKDSIIRIPDLPESKAIVVLLLNDTNYSAREEKVKSVIQQAFKVEHIKTCAVIGININQNHYPYSIIAFCAKSMSNDGSPFTDITIF